MKASSVMVLMIVGLTVLLPAQPPPAGPPSDFLSILQQVERTAEVESARYRVERAQLDIDSASYRGDVSFSLTPTWRTQWLTDEDFDPYHEVTATASTSIPVGLSSAERDRLNRAIAQTEVAQIELHGALLSQAAALYAHYSAAYSAWAQIPVLELELEAARVHLTADDARYQIGELSLVDLFKTQEDYRRAQQSLENGTMRAELAILELLLKTGADIETLRRTDEILQRFAPASPLQDQYNVGAVLPDRLPDAVSLSHPRLAAQAAAVDAAIADMDVHRDPLLSSVRVSYSSDDGHGGSVSFSVPKPTLSLSVTPPGISVGPEFPSAAGRSSSDKDRITLSTVFSLNTSGSRTRAEDIAAAAARFELARLEQLSRSVEAEIHSRRRQIDSAVAAGELAREALERAQASYEAVQSRDALGQVSTSERAAAVATLERARLNVLDAELDRAVAVFNYAAAAHLPSILPEALQGALFGGSQ